jgi:hypothetical protein
MAERRLTTGLMPLVEVGRPLLASVNADGAQWQTLLGIIQLVWNGLVRLEPKSVICAELRDAYGPRNDAEAVVDLIATRKCELYPDDMKPRSAL